MARLFSCKISHCFRPFRSQASGAFYLVRRFTHHTAASLVGGYIFAFNPSHVAHAMQHMGVSHIEFLPFFVVAYLKALEKESLLWLAAAIAACARD